MVMMKKRWKKRNRRESWKAQSKRMIRWNKMRRNKKNKTEK